MNIIITFTELLTTTKTCNMKNQKVFAIINKETKEIVMFGVTAAAVYAEWNNYYVGEAEELTHELQQTFMPVSEVRVQFGL